MSKFPGGLVALVVVFAGEAGLAMEQPEADSYEPIGLPWLGICGMRCRWCQRFSGEEKQNHGISLTVILKRNMEKCEVNASAFTRSNI